MNEESRSRSRGPSRTRISKRSPVSTSQPVESVRRAARRVAARTHEDARGIEAEVVRFRTGDRSIDFNVDVTEETVWATQQQIADLFGKDAATISEHIQNIKDDRELEATTRKFRVVRREGDREVEREIEHYDLDMILAVGHRVKSPNATAFRKWAYGVLRQYVVKGYALNERRLRDDPRAADDLAARLRAIRSEEKHVFAKVRDFFKFASTDYDPTSRACRTFYARLQDKCHFAATGHTASQLILTRADCRTPNMGMASFEGQMPTVADAKVGKNYLSEEELHILHIVSEQFLLHVESKALRNKTMTMKALIEKFDELLRVGEYAIFQSYGKDHERGRADKHAIAEHARYMMRQKRVAARP